MVDVPLAARRIVTAFVNERAARRPSLKSVNIEQVYVVWSVKVLRNWKALVVTELKDGMYYEVTHNGAKSETYVDAYQKVENVAFSDDDFSGTLLAIIE